MRDSMSMFTASVWSARAPTLTTLCFPETMQTMVNCYAHVTMIALCLTVPPRCRHRMLITFPP